MAVGPYSPCPCGSGKQFKWCCSPIYAGINHALDQDSKGQHETALRLIDQVVTAHPDKPEAWGQKARLLAANGKLDEAEEALQKAFDLNPNYPFGLLLRAHLRWEEGEVAGALLLARRAAEAYSPEALDFLADVYRLISEAEARLNRLVAARAALRIYTRCQPADEAMRTRFEELFGPKSQLPEAVRREYTLLGPDKSLTDQRRAAWDKALGNAASPRLGDLARLFDQLTRENATDAAAWYNLGVTRAWLGDNSAALDALQRFLELDQPEEQAATAATLMEVLRFGLGLEDQMDYLSWSFFVPLQQPQPFFQLIEEWQHAGQLLSLSNTEQEFFGLILELNTSGLVTAGGPAVDQAGLAGYLSIAQGLARIWGPNKEAVDRLRETVRQRLGLAIGAIRERKGPRAFSDVVVEALIFPTRATTGDFASRVLDHAAHYFEETWIHQPRRALSGTKPIEAAGQRVLRKKLRGVIHFLQDCAAQGSLAGYDFDRLRRKLGLLAGSAPTAASVAPADITALDAGGLAALEEDKLAFEQLEQAYQAAQKLNADDLAVRFARALIGRPPQPERPDRYPWYSFLTQKALGAGNTEAALDLVNEGEKADCEQNEGRRRNDYELRRGQVHVKRGEVEAAHDVFQRLIERVPANLKYRGSAAEAMLTLKQGERALRFAEEGVAKARQQNDRDSEQYLLELAGAARKQMG